MVKLNIHFWLIASVATSVHARRYRGRILRPRDTTYSANVRDTGIGTTFGFPGQTTTVDAGVTYFISGQGPHPFFGNVNNYGSIIVSQTNSLLGVGGLISTPLVVPYIGTGIDGDLRTFPGSLISLNDYGDVSPVGVSTYNWELNSMVNGGTMQWCGNGNVPTGSVFTLNCLTNTCTNNGLITWEQYNGDPGIAFNWASGVSVAGAGASGFTPTNNGAFRLINTDLQITQNIVSTVTGGGCFVLATNGLLSLLAGTQSVTGQQTFAGQSIYFSESTAGLYITPAIYALNQNFGARLYGFGTGNYIAFTDVLNVFTPFSYSGSTLTVNFALTSIKFNIGTGYTASNFRTQLLLSPDVLRIPQGVYAIRYNGAAPAQTIPTVCSVTYPRCANPESTVTASFPSSTTSTSLSISASLPTTTLPTGTGSGTVTGTDLGVTTIYVTSTATSIGITDPLTVTIPPVGTGPGTVTGTVSVIEPGVTTVYVTQTSTSDGIVAPSTVTIPPVGTGPGTVTGTVEIINPGATTVYVTITSTSIGIAAPVTTTIPPTATGPGTVTGTVEIVNPGITTVYVTITTVSVGISAPSTTTIPPTGSGPGTITGTVEVISPAQFVTLTTISGTAPPFTTTIAPSGQAPGTVLIVDPATYVTITAMSVGASAPVTYTIQPTGTAPGTIVVVDPSNTNFVTTTIPYTGTVGYSSAVTVSTAQPSGTVPGTVYVSLVDATLATITRPYSGSVTITTTIPPAGGAPGTVEILTPTVSRPAVLSTTVGPNQCVCRPIPT